MRSQSESESITRLFEQLFLRLGCLRRVNQRPWPFWLWSMDCEVDFEGDDAADRAAGLML